MNNYSGHTLPNKFKSLGNRTIIDPKQFLVDAFAENPKTKIHVGVDSADIDGKQALYALVIAVNFPHKGARAIYTKMQLEVNAGDISSYIFNRLFNEASLSADLVEYVRSLGFEVDVLDYDFNIKERGLNGRKQKQMQEHLSNKLISTGRGFAESLQVKYTFKPEEQIACVIADHLLQ